MSQIVQITQLHGYSLSDPPEKFQKAIYRLFGVEITIESIIKAIEEIRYEYEFESSRRRYYDDRELNRLYAVAD